MRRVLLLLLLALGTPSLAFAQTQTQADRIETLARYIVTAPVCEKLGFVLPPDAGTRLGAAAAADMQAMDLEGSIALDRYTAAVDRQLRASNQDMDQAAAKSADDPPVLKALFLEKGAICVQAASDRALSKLMPLPAGFNLQRAAQDAADVILAPGGLASWQTADIQARGDLMMLASGCRAQIGAARSDTLYATYVKSSVLRERTYYQRTYDEGLKSPFADFTKTQCENIIAKKEAAAAPTH